MSFMVGKMRREGNAFHSHHRLKSLDLVVHHPHQINSLTPNNNNVPRARSIGSKSSFSSLLGSLVSCGNQRSSTQMSKKIGKHPTTTLEELELERVKGQVVNLEELLWESQKLCRWLQNENSSLRKELLEFRQGQKISSQNTVKESINLTPTNSSPNMSKSLFTHHDEEEENDPEIMSDNFLPPFCSTMIPTRIRLNRQKPPKERNSAAQFEKRMLGNSIVTPGVTEEAAEKGQNILKKCDEDEPGEENKKEFFALVQIETEWNKKKKKKQGKTGVRHFVAQVKSEAGHNELVVGEDDEVMYVVDFYKKASFPDHRFILSENEVNLLIGKKDLVQKLPSPKLERRGFIRFDFDFGKYFM